MVRLQIISFSLLFALAACQFGYDVELLNAVKAGRSYEVKSLLKKGADVNIRDKEKSDTPLIIAALHGRVDIVQLLLEYDANVNTKQEDGMTALMMAAMKGHVGILQLLIFKGADVEAKDGEGVTALMWAAAGGHIGVVVTLLDKDVDTKVKDDKGRTALEWAGEDVNITRLIKKRSAKLYYTPGK